MDMEIFQSGALSLVLSYVATCWALFHTVMFLWLSVADGAKATPKWLVGWIVFCFIGFSPLRYILFQGSLLISFPFQSWAAFGKSFVLSIYAPWLFGAIAILVVLIPLSLALKIAADEPTPARVAAGFFTAPLLCAASTLLFVFVLNPLSGWTIGWVGSRDMIRATNGPARFIFDHVASVAYPVRYPFYFDMTEQSGQDAIRCHVADIYLSKSAEFDFVSVAYPRIVDRVTKEHSLSRDREGDR